MASNKSLKAPNAVYGMQGMSKYPHGTELWC